MLAPDRFCLSRECYVPQSGIRFGPVSLWIRGSPLPEAAIISQPSITFILHVSLDYQDEIAEHVYQFIWVFLTKYCSVHCKALCPFQDIGDNFATLCVFGSTGSSVNKVLVGSSRSGSSSAIFINSPVSILDTDLAGIGGRPAPRRVALVALSGKDLAIGWSTVLALPRAVSWTSVKVEHHHQLH